MNIQLENLTLRYGRKVALNDLTAAIEPAYIFFLVKTVPVKLHCYT